MHTFGRALVVTAIAALVFWIRFAGSPYRRTRETRVASSGSTGSNVQFAKETYEYYVGEPNERFRIRNAVTASLVWSILTGIFVWQGGRFAPFYASPLEVLWLGMKDVCSSLWLDICILYCLVVGTRGLFHSQYDKKLTLLGVELCLHVALWSGAPVRNYVADTMIQKTDLYFDSIQKLDVILCPCRSW